MGVPHVHGIQNKNSLVLFNAYLLECIRHQGLNLALSFFNKMGGLQTEQSSLFILSWSPNVEMWHRIWKM